jgi:prepilin signal peptidase PulO-like enzyme (type II secretory pathway)
MPIVEVGAEWCFFAVSLGTGMLVKFRRLGGVVLDNQFESAVATVSADFYIDLVTALWLGFTGACIGSFLNVVAYRLPLGMSVVWKPSHCPKCGHPIRARDNVPVLGWLILRGKCRDCGAAIAPRYAIVEAILACVFFVLAYVELFRGGENLPGGPITGFTGAMDLVWNPSWAVIGVYAYHCLAVTILLAIALIDRDGHRAPWRLIACGIVAGLLPPFLAKYLWQDSLVLNPFWFPQPASINSYLIEVLVQIVIAVAWARIIAVPARLESNRVFNLAVALSIAGLFLGVSGIYRVVFFAMFLFVHAIIALTSTKKDQGTRPPTDAVWLALVVLLIAWPMIASEMDL